MIKSVLAFALLALACSSATVWAARAVSSHLEPHDLTRLQKVFVDGLSSNDLQAIFYSTLNVEATNAGDKAALCKRIGTLHEESKLNAFEKDYYFIGAHKNLRCPDKLPESLLSQVYAIFKKQEQTSSQEIHYRVATHKLLGVQVDEASTAKLIKTLQDLLKKDDSLVSLGYAFAVAPELGAGAAFVAERVEDAIVQADEVDTKMLQFEGGLSITALIVNGAFSVSKANNRAAPVSAVQAEKLAAYFLSRRSVQTPKGAHVLIEALKSLSADPKVAPICIQLIGSGQLQADAPQLSIAVVDLLGKALSPAPQNIFGKILVKKDNSVLAEKVQFVSKSSDKTTFAADLAAYKPTRGIYVAEISADSAFKQQLQFKVLGRVKVHSLELFIADSDVVSSSVKKQTVAYPNKLAETLSADSTQKLVLKTVLVDEGTTKVITVHQAFVRLYNKQSDQEIIFVAEQDSNKAYKFDMDVGARAADFGYQSGDYEINLIIGDASLSNSFQWHVANVQLKFSQDAKEPKKQAVRAALPEIVHQFRVPEKRPPRFVSDVFTGLCLTPLVLLFAFWGKLGINVSNFSLAPSTIGFHLGLGGMLTLFAVFWWKLDMFHTLRLLIPIAVFTFLCGNRLLRRIYAQRVSKSGGGGGSVAATS